MKAGLRARAVGAAVILGGFWGGGAAAEERPTTVEPAQQAQAAPAADDVADWSRWQIRVRALGVIPDTSGASAIVRGVPALSSPNSGLSVSNSVVPELDITYYFTKNLSAELILGVTQHWVTGTGTLSGLKVGSTWVLPPTLTLQYHVTELGAFQPYFGVGLNYSIFFSQRANGTPNAAGLGVTNLSIHNAVGFAAQVGFDYMINRNWGMNFDVKKLLLQPSYNATVNNAIPVTGSAALNPWLIGAGVTYRF